MTPLPGVSLLQMASMALRCPVSGSIQSPPGTLPPEPSMARGVRGDGRSFGRAYWILALRFLWEGYFSRLSSFRLCS